MKRIAILDEDGTVEIGGVRHKLVPVDCIEAALESLGSFCSDHGWSAEDMDNMDWLAAAAAKPDLSALPVVPQMRATRRGHTTLYQIGFNNALFAIGVKQYPEAFTSDSMTRCMPSE